MGKMSLLAEFSPEHVPQLTFTELFSESELMFTIHSQIWMTLSALRESLLVTESIIFVIGVKFKLKIQAEDQTSGKHS